MTPNDTTATVSGRSSDLARGLFLATALLISLSTRSAHGQETAGTAIEVVEAVIASGIENLTPVSPGETFDAGVGKLYCLTRVKAAGGSASIKHLWFYGDRMVMEITLPVKSALWRTYSSKTILPNALGDWRVVVTAEDGTVLRTLHFTVR